LCDNGSDAALRASLFSCSSSGMLPLEVVVSARRPRHELIRTVAAATPCASLIVLVDNDAPASEAEGEARALEAASGQFVAFLTPGDQLADGALAAIQSVVNSWPNLCIIYTDEDWIDEFGDRLMPRFKTGWDPDAQLGLDLLGRLCVMQRDLVLAAGGLDPAKAPAHHYDLHCRVTATVQASTICHVPEILYHRLQPPPPVEGDDDRAQEAYIDAARRTAQEAAIRVAGRPVRVSASPLLAFVNRIHWPLPHPPPLVSIIVPTRDKADMLRVCTGGILRKTDYPALELLVLDNDSVEPETADLFQELQRDPRVRILALPGPFNFSALNNAGAGQARGEILLFLNNDVEVIEPNWLREMVSQVLRPDIGCVGAKLLYADQTIQHAGIVLQSDPLAMHVFRTRPGQEFGQDANLAGVRGYLAVTAACMAMRRKLFDSVGGFDEKHLKIAYNDVDLCLRVDEAGYRNICSPFATLLHWEGATRSADSSLARREMDRKEQACLLARWLDRFERDPYSHPRIKLDWNEGARIVPSVRPRRWNTLAR